MYWQDYTGTEGQDMCVLLNLAYETLGDAEERATYDMQLAKAQLDDEDGYSGQQRLLPMPPPPISGSRPTVCTLLGQSPSPLFKISQNYQA